MAINFKERIVNGWNAFRGIKQDYYDQGPSSSTRNDRVYRRSITSKSVVGFVYNRIAMDVAAIPLSHVILSTDAKVKPELVNSGLNYCLTEEANIDESATAFIQNVVYSMFDDGVVAVLPIDVETDKPELGDTDILTMRVGQVILWYPNSVRLKIYNDNTGLYEEITVPKSDVAILENPLYASTNEQNSVLNRLVKKIAILDEIDNGIGGSKLDLIIQNPYPVRTKTRKELAASRSSELEEQLSKSKHGIAYMNGEEKIIQLNRPVTNTLIEQINDLRSQLYTQLGLTESIFNGTATPAELLNYHTRTIDPILKVIISEYGRTFIKRYKRLKGECIYYKRNPFSMIPIDQMSDILDTVSRNAILTTNEVRPLIGVDPSPDPEADKLQNKNIADKNQKPALLGDDKIPV